MTTEFFHLGKRKFDEFKRSLPANQLQDTNILIDGAYVVQEKINGIRERRGDEQIGYKVGCISETIQNSLGIFQPIFGRLYAGQCWNSGMTLPLNEFDGLAVEGELAVTLNQPINEIIDQELELSGVIQAVFPVIELHTYPFERPPTAAEMIARNAIHAGFVYDKNTECSNQFPDQITIKIDEIEVACVSGAVNYETVLHSLRWLAMTLKKKGLKTVANQIVLCGSAAPLFPLRQGGDIEVTTDTDIKVECSIKP